MAELRDLYDINSNKTDKTYRKGETIPDGYYPMVVMVVIRNSKGEFLMQKRVEAKGGDCYKMYFVNKDVVLEDIKIQEEELSEVRWFSMDELHRMVDNGELNNNQISCFIKVCEFLVQN